MNLKNEKNTENNKAAALEAVENMFDEFRNSSDKKPPDKGDGSGYLEIRVVSSKTLKAN